MPKLVDLTGQRFGKLTVLKKAPSRNGKVYWLCQCDCGNIKQIRGDSLKSGKTQSCGCYHKEISKEICRKIGKNYFNDLTGKKFGEWTVLKDSGKRRNNGSIIWTCQCSCGTIKDLESRFLLEGISTSCGCKKISSKGQLKISNLLQENNIFFTKEKTFETCILPDSKKKARFDFYVNNKYLIEYDGEQHFISTSSKNSYFTKQKIKKIQEHDLFKTNWCKQNNIPLIRIPYTHYKDLKLKDLLLETSTFLV